MDQLLGSSETDWAKRDWEQLNTPSASEDSETQSKRRRVETPCVAPRISSASGQLGDIDMSSPPDYDPLKPSANHWLSLPDIGDIDNPLLTPDSGYSDLYPTNEITPAPSSVECNSQIFQTSSDSSYDVCFGMVSDLSILSQTRNGMRTDIMCR